MKKLSIDDVARKAGVSIATVSRVINSPELVKEKTRKRVEEVIAQHNYMPLSNARNLSKRVSSMLCIIVPEINNPFCSGVIKGITEIATSLNFTTLCFTSEENYQNEIDALQKINQIHIAGLFYMPCQDYKNDQKGKKVKHLISLLDAPVILIDRRSDYLQLGGVYYDDATAMYEATNILLAKGHKKIALISGSNRVRQTTDREFGFSLALQDAGIENWEQSIYAADYNVDVAYRIAKKLLAKKQAPTAIIGMSNMITIGLIKALSETQLKLGQDIDIFGLDSIDALQYIGTNISFIERDPVKLGNSAARLIVSMLDERTKAAVKLESTVSLDLSNLADSNSPSALTFEKLPPNSYLYKAKMLFPRSSNKAINAII